MYYTKRLKSLKESILEEIKPGGKLHHSNFDMQDEGYESYNKEINIPVTDPHKLITFLQREKEEMNLYFFEIYKAIDLYFEILLGIQDKMLKFNSYTRFIDNSSNFWLDDIKYLQLKFYNVIVRPKYLEYLKYQDRLLVEEFQSSKDSDERLIQVIQELEGELLFDPSEEIENRISYFKGELERINSIRSGLENEKSEFSTEKDLEALDNLFKVVSDENSQPDKKMDRSRYKFIMLNELGIIDFLQNKLEYLSSETKLADILKDITSTHQQHHLNAYKHRKNRKIESNNDPYKKPAEGRENPVEFVKNRLRAYGVILDE
jgi:hypothetical protein